MVDKYIKDTLDADHIISIPIEYFTKDELEELSEKAKKNKILLTLRAEHSNVHQGVLVNLIRKDIVNKTYFEWL